jgi:hypothetical protein
MRRLLPFLLLGAACAPGTLGSGGSTGSAGTSGKTPLPPVLPQPLTSCGDGRIDAVGETDEGSFVATAIRAWGTACDGSASVVVSIAGNKAAIWDFSFTLQAQYLPENGLRVPLGEQVVWTTLHGGRAMVTVDITVAGDAYWRSDGGVEPRLEGSFVEYDGGTSIEGTFSCPFCDGIRPCIIEPE